jgi:hypothetical protein
MESSRAGFDFPILGERGESCVFPTLGAEVSSSRFHLVHGEIRNDNIGPLIDSWIEIAEERYQRSHLEFYEKNGYPEGFNGRKAYVPITSDDPTKPTYYYCRRGGKDRILPGVKPEDALKSKAEVIDPFLQFKTLEWILKAIKGYFIFNPNFLVCRSSEGIEAIAIYNQKFEEDEQGKSTGVEYWKIAWLATNPLNIKCPINKSTRVAGAAIAIFGELVQMAANSGLGIKFQSHIKSKSFYDRFGLEPLDEKLNYAFSPEEVAKKALALSSAESVRTLLLK